MTLPPNTIAPQELARLAVERFIREGEMLAPPANPEGTLAGRAGAFVTIRATAGRLRGCIGTIEPQQNSLAEEIIHNAVSAATRDPRFPPVSAAELNDLSYGVDVLSPPEPARGLEDLDPVRFGVIIQTLDGTRRALLLPRIETIHTAEDQWLAVHAKAGISPGTPVRVERFTVTRYGKD